MKPFLSLISTEGNDLGFNRAIRLSQISSICLIQNFRVMSFSKAGKNNLNLEPEDEQDFNYLQQIKVRVALDKNI